MKNTCRILLIDDDEEDFIITKDLLKSVQGKKCEIDWSESYEEAIKKNTPYDIYLVDYRLGLETGLDVIKKLRAQFPDVPVIILTGLADSKVDLEVMKAGASDYLVKGKIDAEQLERAIRYALEHAKHLQQIKDLNQDLEKRVAERTSQLSLAVIKLEETNQVLANQIEENKRTQKELEYRELMLRETQRIGKSSGYNLNLATNEVEFGKEFFDIIEMSSSQIGNHFNGLKSIIHPTDLSLFENYCKQVVAGKNISSIEVRFVLPNNKIKYIYIESKIRYNDNHEAQYLFSFTQDITQRKIAEIALVKSQQMLAVVAKNYPNGIIGVYNKSFICEFIEGQEIQKLGLNKSDFLGKTIGETFGEKTGQIHHNYLKSTLQGHNEVYEINFSNNNYLFYTTPIKDDHNKIERMVVVGLNITQIKEAEEQIRQALDKANELSEMKSRFISMASHEFRTPLSTILSSLNLMTKYYELKDDNKFKSHTIKIKSAITNLTEILEYFLSVEKLDTGHFKIEPDTFDLVDFINQHIEDVKDVLKEKQRVVLQLSPTNLQIHHDKKLIRTILQNLISNAIKYSPDNGEIKISLTNENNEFVISVSDNGIGIPEKEQKHLFERFYRAQNAANIQGTGIGLNIIKKYIELIGGNITFTSILNQGTTFKVNIPIILTPELN
jgi:signal transduction histidine kinase/FixJ family two-component response regulator